LVPQLLTDRDYPCETVVGRSLSHADRTPCLRAPGSRPHLRPETAGRLAVVPRTPGPAQGRI